MPTQKPIEIRFHLSVPIARAWELWTGKAGLEKWLTVKGNVEPKLGGKYELFWEPEHPERNSTLGCRITRHDSPTHLAFEWRGPVQFHDLMNSEPFPTAVEVTFEADREGTEIGFRHTGWGDTQEWDEARIWQENAWRDAFEALRKLTQETTTVSVEDVLDRSREMNGALGAIAFAVLEAFSLGGADDSTLLRFREDLRTHFSKLSNDECNAIAETVWRRLHEEECRDGRWYT